MFNNIEEFELNLLEIENYQKSSESRLRFWFNHIRDNALIDNGNIFLSNIREPKLHVTNFLRKEALNQKKINLEKMNLKDGI